MNEPSAPVTVVVLLPANLTVTPLSSWRLVFSIKPLIEVRTASAPAPIPSPCGGRTLIAPADAKDEQMIPAEELPQIKKDAEVKGVLIELKPCQQLLELKLP